MKMYLTKLNVFCQFFISEEVTSEIQGFAISLWFPKVQPVSMPLQEFHILIK